jgi:Zn finger protein HypA/HybF involved in hydrogenase expression
MSEDALYCDTCGEAVEQSAAIRSETYGDLDSDRWQTLCCPECGSRLKTVFVGREE